MAVAFCVPVFGVADWLVLVEVAAEDVAGVAAALVVFVVADDVDEVEVERLTVLELVVEFAGAELTDAELVGATVAGAELAGAELAADDVDERVNAARELVTLAF